MRMNANQTFNFFPVPTDLHFGCGVRSSLPERLRALGSRRPFLVTDPGLRAAGLAERVEALLAAGMPPAVFDRVQPDSSSELIDGAAAELCAGQADSVVGLGGGSSLDTAKAAAAMATNPGSILDYAGLPKLVHRLLPMVAVPTTAGTGSEVTLWSVFTDDTRRMKSAAGSFLLYPSVALRDPELTLGLPPALTAATGMDALGHAIECFTNEACQPISAALAREAIELIGRHLRTAVREPLGVVAAISPWNFPVVTPVRKIAPALAYGNAVVFKPASLTPWSATCVVKLLEAAGVPAGVVNLVIGSGREVGEALVDDGRVGGITFTGSTAVGIPLYERAARLLAVGRRLAPDPDTGGYYYALAVFDHVAPDSPLALEEIFGPVLPVIRVGGFDEAVAVANGTRYGLAAALFTSKIKLAHAFIRRVQAGMIHINHGTASQAHVPFSGVKDSGQGAYSIGHTAKDSYCNLKMVYVKWVVSTGAGQAPAWAPQAQPVQRAERVYQALLRGVIRGDFRWGAQLSMAFLAQQFRVSATPVSDALNRLEKDDLLVKQPYQGWMVRRFEEPEVRELYEVRSGLECFGVGPACERITAEQIQWLRGHQAGPAQELMRRHLASALEEIIRHGLA